MAAARQKEMNVSITEDATISRTRSEGGATVVRVDAIVRVSSLKPVLWNGKGRTAACPALSLCPIQSSVKPNRQGKSSTGFELVLVLSEQLFAVMNKTDEHNHGRPCETEEKHRNKRAYRKGGQNHASIVACFRSCGDGGFGRDLNISNAHS